MNIIAKEVTGSATMSSSSLSTHSNVVLGAYHITAIGVQ